MRTRVGRSFFACFLCCNIFMPAKPDLQNAILSRKDDLHGSVQQYLRMSGALYAQTAPPRELLALLRKELEDSRFGVDPSPTEGREPVDAATAAEGLARRAVSGQVLTSLLLSFGSPEHALQLLGCSLDVPAEGAWREVRTLPTTASGGRSPEEKFLDFSLVEVLLDRVVNYAQQPQAERIEDASIAGGACTPCPFTLLQVLPKAKERENRRDDAIRLFCGVLGLGRRWT